VKLWEWCRNDFRVLNKTNTSLPTPAFRVENEARRTTNNAHYTTLYLDYNNLSTAPKLCLSRLAIHPPVRPSPHPQPHPPIHPPIQFIPLTITLHQGLPIHPLSAKVSFGFVIEVEVSNAVRRVRTVQSKFAAEQISGRPTGWRSSSK